MRPESASEYLFLEGMALEELKSVAYCNEIMAGSGAALFVLQTSTF